MAHDKTVFLDTNIVLDIVNPERKGNKQAIELWKLLIIEKYTIIVSEDMLSTIFYINKDKRQTLEFFKLIQKRWQIVPFGKDVVAKAVDVSLKKDLDLEDILQCLCAKENGCKVLITNDKNFYDCGVEIISCGEFLNGDW